MERATGERFDRLMARLVLAPLGLDACYNWTTCSEAAVAGAAALTDATGVPVKDDLRGQRPDCAGVNRLPGAPCSLDAYRPGDNGAVFSPQGGLRVSALGLARIGRLLLGDGQVDGVRILNPATVALMRTPQWRYDGHNGDSEDGIFCAWGLGVHLIGVTPGCRDDLFADARLHYGHSGEAYHLRSGLWLDPAARAGVAFVATANPNAPPLAPDSAFTAVERRLARGVNLRYTRAGAVSTGFSIIADKPLSLLDRCRIRIFRLCRRRFQALFVAGDPGADTTDGGGVTKSLSGRPLPSRENEKRTLAKPP
jgi:CubicO group peptidase (beta-lactamase class C family)